MRKLYKEDKGSLLYAEYWKDENEIKEHTGQVGKIGKTKIYVLLKDFDDEQAYIKHFNDKFESKGFTDYPEEKHFWLVLQYPLKSITGAKRDHWLKDKSMEYLDEELGWKGVGHVDGFDMGRSINIPDKYVLNVFCKVVDEEVGVAAIKRCTRKYTLDYTWIKIASRTNTDDSVYELKYDAKKKGDAFSI